MSILRSWRKFNYVEETYMDMKTCDTTRSDSQLNPKAVLHMS